MKKVLFYFNNYCGESSHGGTEIATYRIAKALKESGECEIYHAYHGRSISSTDIYDETINLPKDTNGLSSGLADFIRKHEIDNVVVMSRFFKYPKILKGIEESGRNPNLIFMQHFAPGSEKKKTNYKASWHLLRLNPKRLKYYLRALFYPVLKLPRTLRWKSVYKNVYDKSDHIVLLSEGYKEEYSRFAGIADKSKFVAIPNIFEIEDNRINLDKKEKRVLIMSRMDELQKRISLALAIWRKIEDDPDLADWHLDIVGTGNNTDIVKRLIKKYDFERVTYHGWQQREPFLEKSSILMLTSEYEGLPLSILEARTFGCVPIAFDSFASLKDVVTNYENGVVVDNFGDLDTYVKRLSELMYDSAYRLDLAKNSKSGLDTFSSKNIAEKWLEILT